MSAAPHPAAVLIGPPGAGKSTVAAEIAASTGWEHLDTDDVIVEQAGMPISDIFVEHGEAHFRGLEADVVRQSLTGHDGILSLGGGAPMHPDTAALLDGHVVVFLDVDVSEAARRVGMNTARPLLAINPRAQLNALLKERRPRYQELATFTVDTTGREPQDIAAEILTRLEELA
ncbi:shikimate kinase [Branchiibius sp. NY16-3462-2]|uniref:shikimate kinase n=1 Tax=Branchiibius sp. NY16-3462-2 TaxID=1807500 RepID=UPI00079A0ED9|nr:shikimate kinase [Branchiibius sp. NY16-3462-2]